MGEHVRSFKTAYGKGSVCFDRIHFANYEFESLRTLFFEMHSRDFSFSKSFLILEDFTFSKIQNAKSEQTEIKDHPVTPVSRLS
jgi:hypothetical protein